MLIIHIFQDETQGQPIKEFIGLRSKLYSILLSDDKWKYATAGVKSHVTARQLHHNDFHDVLQGKVTTVSVNQNSIRAYKHKLYSIAQQRVGLSCIDNKRFVLEDGVHTRAHGHWRNKCDI